MNQKSRRLLKIILAIFYTFAFQIPGKGVAAPSITEPKLKSGPIVLEGKLHGIVKVNVQIDGEGKVTRANVIESELPREYQQRATEAAKSFTFYPALGIGRPRKASQNVFIRFSDKSQFFNDTRGVNPKLGKESNQTIPREDNGDPPKNIIREITKDRRKPIIEVYQLPADSFDTQEEYIRLEGKVFDNHSIVFIKIVINNVTVFQLDQPQTFPERIKVRYPYSYSAVEKKGVSCTFSDSIHLDLGENIIDVLAIDESDNLSKKKLTVYYKPIIEPPELKTGYIQIQAEIETIVFFTQTIGEDGSIKEVEILESPLELELERTLVNIIRGDLYYPAKIKKSGKEIEWKAKRFLRTGDRDIRKIDGKVVQGSVSSIPTKSDTNGPIIQIFDLKNKMRVETSAIVLKSKIFDNASIRSINIVINDRREKVLYLPEVFTTLRNYQKMVYCSLVDTLFLKERKNTIEIIAWDMDGNRTKESLEVYSTYEKPTELTEVEAEIPQNTVQKSKVTQVQERKKTPPERFPPDLYVENLRITEPSGNSALDGLETGSIQFDLSNKGRGNAYNIEIKLTPLTSGKSLTFNPSTIIDKLDKKSRQNVSIPISADIEVQSMTRQFRIVAMEAYGFDADPAVISFETLVFAPPDLRIEQVAIDDDEDMDGEGDSYGNGNSIIESGESIEVTAYIQNFGAGNAGNVKAEVICNTTDRNITCTPDGNNFFNLGDIESGDYRKVEFYFYTSKRYSEENIPISIKLMEAKGRFVGDIDLGLKLGQRSPNVVEVQVAKVEPKREQEMRPIEEVLQLADVDKDIPTTKMDGENTLAIIIGIEEYKYAQNADFAERDAQVFREYAMSVLGITERNINLQINEGATSGEFRQIFAEDGWIARRLKKGVTDVIVYYSGHGAPDPKTNKGYIIPYDIDPNYASNGVGRDELLVSLAGLEARSVFVFLDACFSGLSRSEELLVAGLRPTGVTIRDPTFLIENMAVYTAASSKQYSSAYPSKNHGLFTYYLLKGLQGVAKGSDNQLTLDELFQYVRKNVSETAGYLNKEQTPTFSGSDRQRVLVRY